MTQLATLDTLFTDMPPVAAMRIRATGFDGQVLRLEAPLAANVNDKDCAFGGSLASLMTLAGWGWLMLKLGEAGMQAEVYVADSSIRYLLPLYDDLRGEGRLREDQDWPVILRCLVERKRARVSMLADVRNAEGVAVATMEARFALKSPAL
jgi:thioesterase domain-containing protein